MEQDQSTLQCGTSSVCWDPAICALDSAVHEAGMSTVFDRFEQQQPQCKQGLSGTCCTLCSDGPCRITAKASLGVCGASPDLIVARNLLQKAAIGTAGNTYHAENVARTLLAAARGETAYSIKDSEPLAALAQALGIDGGSPVDLAEKVATLVLDDINGPGDVPSRLVRALAPPARLEAWEKLDILPGGVNAEIRTALVKCMTSVNNDPVDLLLTAMRLSLANAYAGLFMINYLQDALLGGSLIGARETNLGLLDPASVNIVSHGHQPLLGSLVARLAASDEFTRLAQEAGAAGIKLYGSMCEGQELLQKEQAPAFAGHLGNWLHQEYALATGAVDLLMMDFNCSIPSLPGYAERFHTKLVSTDQAVRMTGVERLEFAPAAAEETARRILSMAIESYGERGEINVPEMSGAAVTGFTTSSVLAALGGDLKPLLDAVASGSIRGILAVVGCTTVRHGQRGFNIEALTRQLISDDILVISGGCTSSTLQNAGLAAPEAAELAGPGLKAVCESLGVPPVLSFGSCTDIGKIAEAVAAVAAALGVDVPSLPVAVSAPEWLEQKAVADAFFAVTYGLFTHLSPLPPVTGSELVTGVLTAEVEKLTGGKVAVEDNPLAAARMISDHIESKRRGLGL